MRVTASSVAGAAPTLTKRSDGDVAMNLTIRFSQIGSLRRRKVRACDLCGAIVGLDDLGQHVRFHGAADDHHHLDYRPDPGRCENSGDRIVRVVDDMTEVRAT